MFVMRSVLALALLVAAACERVSQTLLVQTGLAATQVALSRNDPRTVQAVTSLLGAGATVGVLLPWSRAQESEADRLGLISTWMGDLEGSPKPPRLSSTTPPADACLHHPA